MKTQFYSIKKSLNAAAATAAAAVFTSLAALAPRDAAAADSDAIAAADAGAGAANVYITNMDIEDILLDDSPAAAPAANPAPVEYEIVEIEVAEDDAAAKAEAIVDAEPLANEPLAEDPLAEDEAGKLAQAAVVDDAENDVENDASFVIENSSEAEAPRSQDAAASAAFAPPSQEIEVVPIKDISSPQSPVPSPQSDISSPQPFPVLMTAAETVLSECVLRFPNDPFALSGDIVTRKMYGVELQRCKFKSVISWTPQTFAAEYEIFSASGELLETVRATRAGATAATVLERFEGAAKTPAPAPALNDAIQDSDVTWLDISMDFVWWKDPVFDGKGRIKDRDCVIIKVFPREPLPGCAAVRLWIDEEQRVAVQAVQLDENGKDARRMWIRSVQKIDERWLVKDIEVETPASKRRTKIHVESAVRADIY